MKNFSLGLKYMFKNFGFVALVWLLPSVFLGLLCNPFKVVEFVNVYPTTTISSFGDIFAILMPFSWLEVLFGVLGVLIVSLFLSMAFGHMENHMRSGKYNFKNTFNFINNNILVVLANVIILAVLYVLLTFLFGSIAFLFHLLFSGLSNIPTIANSIVTIVFGCGFACLYTFLTVVFLTNIQNMLANGYSLKEGISNTMQLIGKKGFMLLVCYLIPFAIIVPFVSLLCKTNFLWIANILCTYIQFMIYSCMTMTGYFELSNTPRYDNRKYYNYNK